MTKIERSMFRLSALVNDNSVVMSGSRSLSNRVAGIPCAVHVDLQGATTPDITITDAHGMLIFTETAIAADTSYAFGTLNATGAIGELTCVMANGGGNALVTIYIRQ